MEGPIEPNAGQSKQAQSAVSQCQSRQQCPYQFAHLMCPTQTMRQSLLTLPFLIRWEQPPSLRTAHVTPSHKEDILYLISLGQPVPKALPSSSSPEPRKAGPCGRSPFPALLLSPPDPLALSSPPVASDQRRTISLNPPV